MTTNKRAAKAAKKKSSLATTPKMARGRALMLRTCAADMSSYGGFIWPKSGEVSAPDWKPTAECGYGLHGLLWGRGDYSLLSRAKNAVWLAVEIVANEAVDIDGKIKVPRGWVVACGTEADALAYISERLPAKLRPKQVTDGAKEGQASASGDYGQASASGVRGQASASGDYGQASASGYRGQASASGYQGQASASGVRGQASASGYQGQASASGDYGQASAVRDGGEALAGRDGVACAGTNGMILIWWYDGARRRVTVGYVGENGIKPMTRYRLDERGAFVEVGPYVEPKPSA